MQIQTYWDHKKSACYRNRRIQYRLNFNVARRTKLSTQADWPKQHFGMSKRLIRKCCKIRKIYSRVNFVYFCATLGKNNHFCMC